MTQQPADNDNDNAETGAEEQSTGRVRWLPFRVNGVLICQINEADPTHLRIVQRRYGQHFVAEFNTKSVLSGSLSGGTG